MEDTKLYNKGQKINKDYDKADMVHFHQKIAVKQVLQVQIWYLEKRIIQREATK